MNLGALTFVFLGILHIGFVESACDSWPSSAGYTCTAGGEFRLLQRGMNSSETEECANLCEKELFKGCCALSQEPANENGTDFNGCYWKAGTESVALSSANYKTITCDNGGVEGVDHSPSGGLLSSSGSGFASGQLRKHNQYRRKHRAGPLGLSGSLNSDAQSHADYLARKGTWLEQSDHDQNRGNNIGENIAQECGIPTAPSGNDATHDWYKEVYDYNPNICRSSNGYQTGHFTQLVWKNSKKLGIAKAKGRVYDYDTGEYWQCVWIVARYQPAGNVGGQYQKNVG